MRFEDQEMSARGVDFLENWIEGNVGESGQGGDKMKAAKLAKRLIADAAAADFTVEDLNLEDYNIEKYILEAMTAPLE